MSVSRNLGFALAASVCTALVGLAVVPIYLRLLGIEAYGLIGIYSSLSALFSLLDFGLAPAINREVARRTSEQNLQPVRELLHTLAFVYWSMAGAIAVVAVLGAPLLANGWLQSTLLPQQTVSSSLTLIGIVIACRWAQALYAGALLGAERMALVSSIGMAMSLLGSVGAVAVLAWVAPRIEAFFVWQAGVGLVHTMLLRIAAWRVVGKAPTSRFSLAALKGIWRFSAGISAVAVAGVLLTQVDKVILSRLLSLSDFGGYTLATVVVSAIYLAVNPVFNVIYPRFTALVAAANERQLSEFYRSGTRLFATAVFPVCMTLAVFSKEIVQVWTGNQLLAEHVSWVVSLLAVGAALHSVMYFPYALQLAYGVTRLPLTINSILVIVAVPLISVLAWQYGTIGGAAASLLLFFFYLLLGAWLTHRTLLPHIRFAWLLFDVGVPLLISICVGVVGRAFMSRFDLTGLDTVVLGSGLLVSAWGASLATAPRETLARVSRLFRSTHGE